MRKGKGDLLGLLRKALCNVMDPLLFLEETGAFSHLLFKSDHDFAIFAPILKVSESPTDQVITAKLPVRLSRG
jgi:hypothetical protein